MSAIASLHQPVLAQRCLDLLAPALTQPGAVFVDGTLGMGGHTELVLETFPEVIAYGIDRDPQALLLASERLRNFGKRFHPVRANYSQMVSVLAARGITQVQGVLLDVGVSSLQLDDQDRGFSYLGNAPLDMRMSQDTGQTAADVLNTYSETELARIFREFGEEKYAYRIAKRIVEQRVETSFAHAEQLVSLVQSSIPRKEQATRGHAAKKVFQALRIEVNQELAGLTEAIPAAISLLAVGGRLVVESYHSLEDRIVKQAMAQGLVSTAPADLPVVPLEHQPYLTSLTRGGEKANESEITANRRAASVRLRAVARTR